MEWLPETSVDELNDADPIPCSPEIVDQRIELILARQWLALSGAGVEVLRPNEGTAAFALIVPN